MHAGAAAWAFGRNDHRGTGLRHRGSYHDWPGGVEIEFQSHEHSCRMPRVFALARGQSTTSGLVSVQAGCSCLPVTLGIFTPYSPYLVPPC
eukprot:COSAG02_NODE_24931_length_673_cov_20.148084_1_plen_90_part_10